MYMLCTCTQVKLIIAKVKKVEGRRISLLLGYWQDSVSWLGHRLQESYWALFYCSSQMLHFFYELNEGKTLLQQKVMTRFIAVVWNRTHNLSEVCLYFIIDRFYTLFWMYIAKINTLPPPHLNLAGRQGVHRLPQVHKHQIYGVKLCEIKEKENLYIVKW